MFDDENLNFRIRILEAQKHTDPNLFILPYYANISFLLSDAAEAVHLRGCDDPALAVSGCEEVERGAERVPVLQLATVYA